MLNTSPVTAGKIVGSRYRIVRELGRGGFGRTYLAEDVNRYNEYCVLKEFSPQVQSSKELQKAQELFRREAEMLYNLQHPQIPKFRELFAEGESHNSCLFLVQDYVPGESYQQLLARGKRFRETEVKQLLLDILPVLEYIHSENVVHRDISPDNLIQNSEGKPVLIDFGSVKQVVEANLYQLLRQPFATKIGKKGYAPEEQLNLGQAFASSDFYALAVTSLVLLTGSEPQDLYDHFNASWRWRDRVNISPSLANILERMLAHRPESRYQTAAEVLQALQTGNSGNVSTLKTVALTPPNSPPTNSISTNFNWRWLSLVKAGSLAASAVILPGILAFSLVRSHFLPSGVSSLPRNDNENSSLSKVEQEQLDKIVARSQNLDLPEAEFYRQVDQLFHSQFPELQKRPLTNDPKDAEYRKQWSAIAEELLDRLESSQ
ncbi:MAG: serine/threonine-protein kinase [Oscillatoria sp. PMC 1068.18]|nr:serine/threonine-protein kinase [Oscillatoria sp. PMC 1076.18]MEC4989044.1 serine/threonine-protein kinase [Oscillatoria sp. PMC 1068.18]